MTFYQKSLGVCLFLFQIACLSLSPAFVMQTPESFMINQRNIQYPSTKRISLTTITNTNTKSSRAPPSIYSEKESESIDMPMHESNDNQSNDSRNKLQIMKRYIKLARKSLVSSMATLSLLFSSGPTFSNPRMNQLSKIPTANAISLKPFSRRTLEEKLAPIPCYCIINPSGNLYLTSLPNGFDVGVIYTDYRDAEEALREMNQANEQAPDANILIITMDKALQLVRQPPRRNGNQILLYQLCPSLQQLKNTNTFHQLGWKGLRSSTTSWKNGFNRKMLKKTGVPVYYSPSIVIRKGFENIRPIFFSMEDLNYAWERIAIKNNAGDDVETSPPDVRTFNLLKVFEWMLNEPQESAKFAFQADTGNQEYVTRILSLKNPYNKRPILNATP